MSSAAEALLRRLRRMPGLRVDDTGEPILLHAGGVLVAKLWRHGARLELPLPRGVEGAVSEHEPEVQVGFETLSVVLSDAAHAAVAERLVARRLRVEHTLGQYLDGSP